MPCSLLGVVAHHDDIVPRPRWVLPMARSPTVRSATVIDTSSMWPAGASYPVTAIDLV
jgi:hypothetical protein